MMASQPVAMEMVAMASSSTVTIRVDGFIDSPFAVRTPDRRAAFQT
jgi:hypothetical protein